jgi:hypothetical protein
MREADQLIENRDLTSQELFRRQLAFASTLESATTLQALPSAPTSAGSAVSEFSKLSYFDVQVEFLKLARRVEYEKLPDTSIEDAERVWLDFNSQQADRLHDEVQKTAN